MNHDVDGLGQHGLGMRTKQGVRLPTIGYVFNHNYEALHKWSGSLAVPHCLPDALRYFVAQRLINSSAISLLLVDQPVSWAAGKLTFADGTILKLPGRVCADEEDYEMALEEEEIRRGLLAVHTEIQRLSRETQPVTLVSKGIRLVEEILRSGPVLGLESQDIRVLVQQVLVKLVGVFRRGGRRIRDARGAAAFMHRAERLFGLHRNGWTLRARQPGRRGRQGSSRCEYRLRARSWARRRCHARCTSCPGLSPRPLQDLPPDSRRQPAHSAGHRPSLGRGPTCPGSPD